MQYLRNLIIMLLFIASIPSRAEYVAHEWGTFTSLVGSNGVTQQGMYHEDEPLPNFVHPFGELRAELPQPKPEPDPFPPPPHRPPCHSKLCFGQDIFSHNIVTQKMETPVIYFYTDREQDVSVHVRFPEGVVTDTYPGPVQTYPTKDDLTTIAGGDTYFSLKVLTAKQGAVSAVDESNIYSHARHVDSNIITSGAETEKFLFYRGIGRFQPRMSITSRNGSLTLSAPEGGVPQAAFLVHVDSSGHGQMMSLGEFAANQAKVISYGRISELEDHTRADIGNVSGEQARGMLADALIRSGLKRDEAYAMVDTWEHGYLKVPGLRLLYILPRNEVDQVLPLTMTPAPQQFVRVFVGRIEVLLDTEETRILDRIASQGSAFDFTSLGRFAEPILRRVSEVYELRRVRDPKMTGLLADLVKKASVIDTGTAAAQ